MNERWSTLPNARRVLQHAEDARPAWLWSGDGQRLLWSNAAAGLFHAKLKKHGLKRAELAVPIKGQVARIVRLGSSGRTSLARIQFLAGDKPISSTCATTPLSWENGENVLLVVGVDPIDPDILQAAEEEEAGDAVAVEPVEDVVPEQADDVAEPVAAEIPSDGGGAEEAAHVEASAVVEDDGLSRDMQDWQEPDSEVQDAPAPKQLWSQPEEEQSVAPVRDDASVVPEADAVAADEEAELDEAAHRLSSLVDRLAADEALYSPLTEEDDHPPHSVAPVTFDGADQDEDEAEPEPANEAPILCKVTGRGFVADARAEDEEVAPPVGDEAPAAEPEDSIEQMEAALEGVISDSEAVERVTRYNFDELSRILTDRVGDIGQQGNSPVMAGGASGVPANGGARSADLINLGGETLVLNRLPLGIMVFRDQQVLFANRAITEMVGYESVESLRQAGLAAIFPAAGSDEHEAGPVNHLVQRDGTLVPVTARLQSVSWQGRPALMLSASTTEVRTGHEDAVRAFAETLADIRSDGFIEANRAGVVTLGNSPAAALLSAGKPLSGQPLSALIGEDDSVVLRAFLERPARFAETSRPCLALRSRDGKSDILLFALGQAGVLQGYFGFVRARETTPARMMVPSDIDPALLARISRGVRRPLNTIVGFADLIRSEAFGALGNERYEGYANDIGKAGQEIAALVDELDDYARLRDGRYLPQRASLDLTGLLESCVIRIREQANNARVIVRNAISETLPRVTADQASLQQAVLNLLASAIDQTATGGAVVISAQHLDDGGIAIHVRDSSNHAVDMAERFVVFRDGTSRDGQVLAPVRSSVGLALTRSLLAVNTVSLSIDPAGEDGMLFSLRIPADLVDMSATSSQG